MIDPNQITPEVADLAERAVDTRGISYHDAYLELGVPELPVVDERNTAVAPARADDHAFFKREFRLTGLRTPEEADKARAAAMVGAPAVRAALNAVTSREK